MQPKPIIFVRKREQSRDATLLAAGYVRRTTVCEPRLSELVTEYRRIGFNVEVIEHRTEYDACGICYEAGTKSGEVYGDVYVRAGTTLELERHTIQADETKSSSDHVALTSRP